MQWLQILIAVVFPFIWIRLTQRFKLDGWLNPIVLCYATGIALSNLHLMPLDRKISGDITSYAIIFAIPLLLISNEIGRWLKHARRAMLSLLLAIIATLIAGLTGFLLFHNYLPDADKLSGMLVGVYAGGTANLYAVGVALKVSQTQTLLLNTSDMICSSVYLLFLTSIGQRVLLRFLPAFKNREEGDAGIYVEYEALFMRLHFRTKLKSLAWSALIGIVITVSSVGLTWLFTQSLEPPIIILLLTSLSIIASLFRRINKHKSAYEIGNYLLLVFSIAMGMQADFSELMHSSGIILAFTAIVILCAILLHFLFAWIFKVDADTVLITSTATIFSPPFVGQVASAMKNKEIVPLGIVAGLIGIASGNYLGIGMAYVLKWLFH